ncbi:hypothetical protein Pint_31750 [Pistacia integerrima]|uniref:Uncharacterized protein n=1 Tax=Pistacia integerrima TaxID=434235 RepID=A0ACC0XNK6_9ROSI|nr:hypothetical protein Pint_31750 [Pistacia integerrima]
MTGKKEMFTKLEDMKGMVRLGNGDKVPIKGKDSSGVEFINVPMRNRSFIVDWSAMDVEALRSKEEKASMLPTVEVIDEAYGSCQVGRQHRLSSPSSTTWRKEKDPQENERVDDVGARGMRSLKEIDQSFRRAMLEPIKEEYHSSQEAKKSKEVKKISMVAPNFK